MENNTCFSEIYVGVGKNIMKGKICVHRPDVAKAYNYENDILGFSLKFPESFLKNQDGTYVDVLNFYLVGRDIDFIYEPVECRVIVG